MSEVTFTLSPSGNLTITERWKSGGRPQQAEAILRGSDIERLRAVLEQAVPPLEVPPAVGNGVDKPATAGTNAANWPAIAAYLLGVTA